jgi:hypothetical protein
MILKEKIKPIGFHDSNGGLNRLGFKPSVDQIYYCLK